MSSDRPAIISGKQRATYRVLDELGRGAMGVVYRAEQVDDRGRLVREVAIKMIRPDVTGANAVKQFRREIASAILLRGEHTVTVFEFGETEAGDLFYVMELIRGPTLRQILDRTPRLPLDRVLEIGRQVCEALDEAHHLPHPVVHRDLKPGNLLAERWDERVWVKVSDFGIAKAIGSDTSTRSETSGSQGTPRYMAPEQCLGGTVDGRADLYSLGIILYEALAGRPPFIGDQMAVMYQHAHQPPPPLPATVPAPIRAVLERLLAKDPNHRPATAEQTRLEFDRAWNAAGEISFGQQPAPFDIPGDSTRPLKPLPAHAREFIHRNPRWRYSLAAGAIAIGLIAALMTLNGTDQLRGRLAALRTSSAADQPASDSPVRSAPQLAQTANSAAEAVSHSADARRRTKVAVLAFRNDRNADPENDWIRWALQASFSTELNKVRQIRVVSRELVDEAALTEQSTLAAVRALGVQKLVTGSFYVHREQIRVDVRLVDADSGIDEMAETVQGHMNDFFGLQKRIALEMLEHLPVTVRQTERNAIEERNPSENPGAALDAYRLMLQGEGLDEDEPGEGEEKPESPQTFLVPPPLGTMPLSRSWDAFSLWPSPASAQERADAEDTIRRMLEEYRLALEKGDLDGITRTKGQLSPRRREGLEQYYKIAEDLQVEFESVEISAIDDRHYAVSYRRRDEFADRRTGEKVSLEVQLENVAVRDGDQWRLTDKRAAAAPEGS